MTEENTVNDDVSSKKVVAKKEKQFRIKFHKDKDSGSDSIELIHNFEKKTFPRNKWMPIDERFIGVVRDAVLQTGRIMRNDVTGEDISESIDEPMLHYTLEQI